MTRRRGILFAPKIGSHNAILVGLAVFLVCALLYVAAAQHWGLFR